MLVRNLGLTCRRSLGGDAAGRANHRLYHEQITQASLDSQISDPERRLLRGSRDGPGHLALKE